jgi:hypothetical protein
MFAGAKIVAISVGMGTDLKHAGRHIAKLFDESICVLASSDFTHFGPGYGYMPFTENIDANLQKLDMGAVDLILKQDSRGFLDYLDRTGATVCGRAPIALLIQIMQELKCRPRLLKYYTSKEIAPGGQESVSYVSIAYDKAK